MTTFVDTSALYALLVQTEAEHAAVAASFRALVLGDRPLVTSNYVVVETTALLQHRIGLPAVRDFDTRILPLLRVRWIDPEIHQRAMERLLAAERRRVSLVDCASFVLMDSEGIRQALALDADFADQGYEVLPGTG